VEAISQNRSFQRVILLAFIVMLVIFASWRYASENNPALSLSNNLALDDSTRTGASTDAQMQSLQERLRVDENDWQAYSQLGLVYLQKVRETGDPAYYQKAEEALDKALSFQSDDYASVAAKGALALARHEFLSALEWGERARQINPDRPYAYGVIADA